MKLFLALIGILLCGYAQAEDQAAIKPPVQNYIHKRSHHSAQPELHMDASVCQQLTKHVPDADVTYRPENPGNGIAPADINASPLNSTIQNQIAIKLYNDTAATLGLKSPQIQQPGPPGEQPTTVPLVQGETDIGYVTFKDNHAYLNGKPLDGAQQDELAVLCIQREKR